MGTHVYMKNNSPPCRTHSMRCLFFLLLLTTTGCHLLNNTRFTPEYIAANDRTVRVEIREVHELANIIMARSRDSFLRVLRRAGPPDFKCKK